MCNVLTNKPEQKITKTEKGGITIGQQQKSYQVPVNCEQ